ncbi:MAG: hypothetical protein OCD76_03160 [Reichenbachiella sp.]
MNDDRIVTMGYVIESFLVKSSIKDAKPKDLMQTLVESNYFTKDHREGLPLRKILRDLDERNMLYLLPQVTVERGAKNRSWFFNPIMK